MGRRTQEAQVGVLLVELGGLEATLPAVPFPLAGLEENTVAVSVCGAGVWGVLQHSSPAWSVSAAQVQSEVLCCASHSREAGQGLEKVAGSTASEKDTCSVFQVSSLTICAGRVVS